MSYRSWTISLSLESSFGMTISSSFEDSSLRDRFQETLPESGVRSRAVWMPICDSRASMFLVLSVPDIVFRAFLCSRADTLDLICGAGIAVSSLADFADDSSFECLCPMLQQNPVFGEGILVLEKATLRERKERTHAKGYLSNRCLSNPAVSQMRCWEA